MATAIPISFGTQMLLIGDGESDEEFSAPCGLTSITKTTNVQANTNELVDCDDPDAVAWLSIEEQSRQVVISASGLLARQALALWREWDRDGGLKNIRYFTDLAGANGGGYFEGPALLTSFEEQGVKGQKWTVSVGLTFDGKPTWVDATT